MTATAHPDGRGRRHLLSAGFGVVLAAALVQASATPILRSLRPQAPAKAHSPGQAKNALGGLPLSFEANQGQADDRVRFTARAGGLTAFLTADAAVLSLPDGPAVRMALVGADPAAEVAGVERLPGVANYLIGDDPARWHTAVPTYAQVAYRGVYPGVDLVYHGRGASLEYDFVVAPRADPAPIALSFGGLDRLEIDRGGDLLLHRPGGIVRQHRPTLFQHVGGSRRLVSGRWVLGTDHQARFSVGRYDRSLPLVIDPVVSYATYLGGSDEDAGNALAVDATGTYLTGSTASTDFPGTGPGSGGYQPVSPLQPQRAINTSVKDGFVVKVRPDGEGLVYSTYLGGSHLDEGMAIAVRNGLAYVTGRTQSPDFPQTLSPTSPDPATKGGLWDAFVTVLNASGAGVEYSARFGGTGDDEALALAIGPRGDAFITGSTCSPDFPATSGAFDSLGGAPGPVPGGCGTADSDSEVFVTVVDVGASQLSFRYSTFLGGAKQDFGRAIAVLDSGGGYQGLGYAYVAGATRSVDNTLTPLNEGFPTTPGAFQRTPAGLEQTFVAKLDDTGSSLLYSTLLGASSGRAIAVDDAGRAYVAGQTSSNTFPVVAGAYQSSRTGGTGGDGFVTRLTPDGSALLASTYLGGKGDDVVRGLAPDSAGKIWVTGETKSTELSPDSSPTEDRGTDAFVARLTGDLAELLYSERLGGLRDDGGSAIAVGADGRAYVGGTTRSSDFPTRGAAVQPTTPNSTSNAFLVVVSSTPAPATTIVPVAGAGQRTLIGRAFPTNLKVAVGDSNADPVAGAQVTFTAPASGPSAAFPGGVAAVTVITGADGTAEAPTLTANEEPGDFIVVASTPGVASTAGFDLVNEPPSAATVTAIAGTPQSAQVNTGFATRLEVLVSDAGSTPVPGATVAFTAPDGEPTGAFDTPAGGTSRTATATTGDDGRATAPAFVAGGVPGSYAVTAAVVDGVGAGAVFALTNTAAPGGVIRASAGTPQSTPVGSAFSLALQATVRDASDQAVAGVRVTFTAPAEGPSGTFPGGTATVSVTTDASGRAGAPPFTANASPGSYTVSATTQGVAGPAGFSLTNTAAGPASLRAVGGTPQWATAGSRFGTPLEALVRDAAGNPLAGATIAFVAPASGPSGAFADGGTTAIATSDDQGVATAPPFTANADAGSYTVEAGADGVAPASFHLTNDAPRTTVDKAPTCAPVVPGPGQVVYPAGFSIVGLPAGTRLPAGSRRWGWMDQGRGGRYSAHAADEALVAGHGYWQSFACPTAVDVGQGPAYVSLSLGAYHASMVGNPTNRVVIVTGHDYAARFDPGLNAGRGGYRRSGYLEPQSLNPGEGLWVFAYRDTTIRIGP